MFTIHDFKYLNLKRNAMKKLYSFTLIAVFILLSVGRIQAQTTQTPQSGLNQIELMKQFIGTWKSESTKDTVSTAEFKSTGNGGMEFNVKIVAQGKIFFELKQLWGYDKKSDKFIVAGLIKDNPNISLESTWFSSKSVCEQVPFEFVNNPKLATSKVTLEFKSPDLVIRKQKENNKLVTTETFKRQKN